MLRDLILGVWQRHGTIITRSYEKSLRIVQQDANSFENYMCLFGSPLLSLAAQDVVFRYPDNLSSGRMTRNELTTNQKEVPPNTGIHHEAMHLTYLRYFE